MDHVDDRFEWSMPKAVRNLHDHKVSFEEARLAFDDPLAIDEYLADDSNAEGRHKRLCLGKGRLLVVIYTERESDDEVARHRIISAWKASKHEQARYNAR